MNSQLNSAIRESSKNKNLIVNNSKKVEVKNANLNLQKKTSSTISNYVGNLNNSRLESQTNPRKSSISQHNRNEMLQFKSNNNKVNYSTNTNNSTKLNSNPYTTKNVDNSKRMLSLTSRQSNDNLVSENIALAYDNVSFLNEKTKVPNYIKMFKIFHEMYLNKSSSKNVKDKIVGNLLTDLEIFSLKNLIKKNCEKNTVIRNGEILISRIQRAWRSYKLRKSILNDSKVDNSTLNSINEVEKSLKQSLYSGLFNSNSNNENFMEFVYYMTSAINSFEKLTNSNGKNEL